MKATRPAYIEVDFEEPILKGSVSNDQYVQLLLDQVELKYPQATRANGTNRIRFNDCSTIIGKLREFLVTIGGSEINPDEAWIEEFSNYLLKSGFRKSPRSSARDASRIRTLTNEMPEDLRNRKILNPKEVKTARRFDLLTKRSKTVLIQFLREGKALKKNCDPDNPILSARLYSEQHRSSIVSYALRLLKVAEKDDLFSVTKDDANLFLSHAHDRGTRDSAQNQLADLRQLFANLQAHGHIDANPLKDYGEKIIKSDHDYVPPDQMELLQDISTVEWDDFYDLQARLICFGLLYDFAFRLNEACGLMVNDVTMGDYVQISIGSENQKGSGKDHVVFYSCFSDTYKLMKRFLELRSRLNPSTDSLLVSKRGMALMDTGCTNMVKQHCEALGVKTFDGNTPAPHRFRHSFPTNNIEPLGLALDLYSIMRRLRHNDYETTYKRYITNNRELNKARHEAKFGPSSGKGGEPDRGGRTPTPSTWISEQEALKALLDFPFTRDALRQYAKENGFLKKSHGNVLYGHDAIHDLATNYVTKKEALGMMGMKNGRFFYWHTNRGIRPITIGKTTLWNSSELLEAKRKTA